jgi:hypothetical protein
MDQLNHLEWVVQQSYEVAGFVFGVRTNSDACADWLRAVFSEYQIDDETDPYYSIFIGERNGRPGKRYHILYEESRAILRTYDPGLLAAAVVSQFEFPASLERADAAFLEAIVVELDGVVALLPSTFVPFVDALGYRTIERTGLRLPVINYAAVDLASGCIVPPRRTLDVPRDAQEMLAQLLPNEGGDGRLTVLQPVSVDVVCSFGFSGETTVPVSPGLAAHTFARTIRNLTRVGGAGVEAVAKLIEGARCYELGGASPKVALESLTELLRANA